MKHNQYCPRDQERFSSESAKCKATATAPDIRIAASAAPAASSRQSPERCRAWARDSHSLRFQEAPDSD